MNCELCNDKIVIVPPPTVCFACASTLQNLRATIDLLRDELHKVTIENGGIKSACATLRGDNSRLRAELAKANKLIERCFDDNYDSGCFRIGTAKAIDDYLETAKEGE